MTKSEDLEKFSNAPDIVTVGNDSFVPLEAKSSAWLIFASLFALISLADLLLNFLRQTSRTSYDFVDLAAIVIAPLPPQGRRSTIIVNDDPDARFPIVHTDPSMSIRRRTSQKSRTILGLENLALIETATLPPQGRRHTIRHNDPSDAWSTVVQADRSMDTAANEIATLLDHLQRKAIIVEDLLQCYKWIRW